MLGRRSITAEMSIRLGRFFGRSARFWFGIQANCDFRRLKPREAQLTAQVTPMTRAA